MAAAIDGDAPGLSTPVLANEEGAEYARAYLKRLQAGNADAEQLAALLEFLAAGEMLRGACYVLAAALVLGARHA